MVRDPRRSGPRTSLFLGVLLFIQASCGGGYGPPANPLNTPPAAKPVLDTVLDRLQPERPAPLADDGSAHGVLPRGAVLIRLRAPWPTKLLVKADGTELDQVSWSDESRAPDAGRFAYDVSDPNLSPPAILLRVDLPVLERRALRVRIEIATQSLANQGTGPVSEWLPIVLTSIHERLELRSATLSSLSNVTDVSLLPGERLVIVAHALPKALSGNSDTRDPAPALIHGSLIYRIGSSNWLQGARSTSPGTATVGSSGSVELAFNVPSGSPRPSLLDVGLLVWRRAGIPADDPDDDLMTDAAEALAKTDPLNPDTDGDGLRDGLELRYGTDPLQPNSALSAFLSGQGATFRDPNICPGTGYPPNDRCLQADDFADSDGDGLHDINDDAPNNPDADGDGVRDGSERGWGLRFPTDPIMAACYDERGNRYSSPKLPDTDWDGLSDGEEIFRWGSDPGRVDTDLDWQLDSEEVQNRTDPRHSNPLPPGDIRVQTGNHPPDCQLRRDHHRATALELASSIRVR
jgi:hypothetical protein